MTARRAGALLPIAGSVAALVAALVVAQGASAHGGADPLAFVQKGAAYAYDPADGHIERIARSAAGDVAVSPDATQVAYVAGDRSLHVVGITGTGDRRVARGPLGSPVWRSASELGATRPAASGGSSLDAVSVDLRSGRLKTLEQGVESTILPFAGGVWARLAKGCATNDLVLGGTVLKATPLDSEVPLDAAADLGILAVVRTQQPSLRCAPASVPVPTALRVFDPTGSSRLVVQLGRIPATRPADGAFSPEGTELAYVTPAGDLAVRSFLTRKDRIVARGGVTALDW